MAGEANTKRATAGGCIFSSTKGDDFTRASQYAGTASELLILLGSECPFR